MVGADAGLHVVVWLNRVLRTQEEAPIARAHAAGRGVYPVTPLYAPIRRQPGLVMGYASLDERTIARGVRMLSEALEAFAAEDGAGRG